MRHQVEFILTAYLDFLILWKDADPDIPILKQAKAENAKLRINSPRSNFRSPKPDRKLTFIPLRSRPS